MTGVLRAVLASAALLLAACQTSQVVMNQPLPRDAAGAPKYTFGYSLPGLMQEARGETLLALAFSGGGKRSAAFAHGALRGLRDAPVTEFGRTHPLLDDVDYIASVSGGSFPAAHYGLYRDQSFATFPKEFLYRDINAYIFGVYLLPWNWEWLFNPYFGTNDAMAQVYDRLMFHGATYADLLKQGLPLVSINATDIAGGVPFAFTQYSFDLLCSNLASFPVARAVAASNGFPILFSPITIASHRQDCLQHPPREAPTAAQLADRNDLSRESVLGRNAERLLDPDRTRFVHLMDGGIADNLALRTLVNALIVLDEKDPYIQQIASMTRRVIVVSVDGQAAADPTLGQQRIVTGLGQVFRAVSGTQIDAFNFETLLLADQQVAKLVATIKRLRCAQGPVVNGHPCDDVRGGLVRISLASIADPAERERLQAIPTGLTIPDADVDALLAAGEQSIQNSATLNDLISGLDVRLPAAAAPGPRAASR